MAFCGAAQANVLYKSVGADGVTMFSDKPPEGAARVETLSITSSGRPAAVPTAVPTPAATLDQLVSSDDAVARANARLDLAESALAQARRGIWSPRDGLQLASHSPGNSGARDVESFKRDVLLARQTLLETLQARGRR